MFQLENDRIVPAMQAKSKDGALQELVKVLHGKCPQLGYEVLLQAVREREAIGSTGVGNGVALPHGKVAGLKRTIFCFGRSEAGIPFEAVDNQPVHYLFMILSPPDQAEEYLHTLAGASRLLKQAETRKRLRLAADIQEIASVFSETNHTR